MNIRTISQILFLLSCFALLFVSSACTPPPVEPTKKPIPPGEGPDECPSYQGPYRADELNYANLPFYNELSRQFTTPDDCIYSYAQKSILHNLRYQTETQSGRTRDDGGFYHLANETVTFYVGDIAVGTAELAGTGSHIITPLEMAGPGSNSADQLVLNIARFLETMDSNGFAHPDDGGTYINEVLISDGMHTWGEGKTLDFSLAEAQFEDAYELLWTNDPAPGVVPPELIGTTTYAIGDTGPAGGIVFYVTDGGTHGLEAGPVNLDVAGDFNHEWGCHGIVTGATGTIIGTGASNTAIMLGQNPACTATNGNDLAAEVVDAYSLNSFTDWALPSRDELQQLWVERFTVNLATGTYWSSSETDANNAWSRDPVNGLFIRDKATYVLLVRPVRAF